MAAYGGFRETPNSSFLFPDLLLAKNNEVAVSYVKLFIDYDSEVLSKLSPFHRVPILNFDL